MATSFSPTRQDVDRYRTLRALSMDLNHKMINTLPSQAYEQIGDALGIRKNGVLVFDNEDMTGVMMDCCLYDWFENGKNVIQRYAETHPAKPGTDEHFLLQAYLRAKYRILVPRSAVRGAGLYCQDILNAEDLFLMDVAFSGSVEPGKMALATRTIPLGDFWMSGGAALPVQSGPNVLAAVRQFQSRPHGPIENHKTIALSIVRACLASGSADHIAYVDPDSASKHPGRKPR